MPTASSKIPLVHDLVWVKRVGESVTVTSHLRSRVLFGVQARASDGTGRVVHRGFWA